MCSRESEMTREKKCLGQFSEQKSKAGREFTVVFVHALFFVREREK